MAIDPPRRIRVLCTIALVLLGVWLWVVQGVTPGVVAAQSVEATRKLHEATTPPLTTRIGVLRAHQRLSRQVPLGRGIAVGHVEGEPGEYAPNPGADRFRGVRFILESGDSRPSGHAEGVGRLIYGRDGLAPGVETVHSFTGRDWMTDKALRADTPRPPLKPKARVYNHSWISGPFPGAEQVLRRADYQIDEHDVVMCVGVNNGRDTSIPALLASAYNVIAVGVSSGNSSGGTTSFEGDGRSKPDLVAPHEMTSFATAIVTACAARLLEAADEMRSDADRARKPETLKAVLMAGATKPPGWERGIDRPLDEHLGAGEVHLDHALRVLQMGPHEPGQLRRRYGWDFRGLRPTEAATYRFTITQPLGESSVVLTWHRRVGVQVLQLPDGGFAWVPVPRTADFDLRLIKVEGEGENLRTVAFSASAVDNVEHVYLPELAPGEYVLEVRRQPAPGDEAWDYAVAWRFEMPDADRGE